MKILFLIYHGFSEYSGISKKIHYQVKGLKENGHDVRLCYYDINGKKILSLELITSFLIVYFAFL